MFTNKATLPCYYVPRNKEGDETLLPGVKGANEMAHIEAELIYHRAM